MKVYKKIIAALLASLMPVQVAGGLDLNSSKVENRIFNSVNLERKKLGRNVFIGGCLTCIGASAAVIGSLTLAEAYKSRMQDVDKLVESLEDKAVADKILEEVKKLQKRSNGIFKVKESFCKVDPYVSLRFLLQVNAILDLLPGFEKLLIRNHSHFFISSYKFTFSTEEFECDSNKETIACFKYPVGKIKHNTKIKISKTHFNSLNGAETKIKNSILSAHNAKVKDGKELESIIVHELGHALQHALFLDGSCMTLDEIAQKHKEEILNIAKGKYNTYNSYVSKYGETNAEEWFAELFAYALLNDVSTGLGRAMQDFLKIHRMY